MGARWAASWRSTPCAIPSRDFMDRLFCPAAATIAAGIFAQGQYSLGKNVLGFTASGAQTDHYLNPVVPENFTNSGTLGDFSVNYQRDLTPNDRIDFIARYELVALPASQRDRAADRVLCCRAQTGAGPCQQQNANNFEPMLIANYRHIFSPNVVGDFRGMVRNNAQRLLFQRICPRRSFSPSTTGSTSSISRAWSRSITGKNEWKVGVESDNTWLHENFNYIITDPSQFDDSTALTFSFPGAYPSQGKRPDLEQSAFVQDLIRLGNWTINAGLRWDHYQLIVNKQSVDPRLPSHATFLQSDCSRTSPTTACFRRHRLKTSCCPARSRWPPLTRISCACRSCPRKATTTKPAFPRRSATNLRVDVNYYLRNVNNYADDDQIENTTISFPIAFQQSQDLRRGSQDRGTRLAWAVRLRQLLLHGGQCVVPGFRRPVPGRRCAGGGNAIDRTLPGFAGPAQHACLRAGYIR